MTAAWVDLTAAILRGTPRLDGALCRGRPELFDPPAHRSNTDDETERLTAAVSVCQDCPVLQSCQAWFDALTPAQRPLGAIAGRINVPRPGRPQRKGIA